MPPETDKDRLRLLANLKNKPELALFQLVQEFKKQITKELEKIGIRAESIIGRKIEEKISQNIFKNIKQLKGNPGKDGYNPIKGRDYFTSSEIDKAIKLVLSKIRIPKDGKDGETIVGSQGPKPVAGIDYQLPKDGEKGKDGESVRGEKGESGSPDTPEEIREKLKLLIGDERLPSSAVKGLKQIEEQVILMGGDRGRRVWPRTVNSRDGTLEKDTTDTTGATFICPSIIKPDTEKVFVNGMRQIKGSSYAYTVTNNKKIVFNSDSIPDVDTGEEILIDYDEDR